MWFQAPPLYLLDFMAILFSFLSFLVDACMKLLAHADTEGLFRKSGSVVRLKALRVSDKTDLSLRVFEPKNSLTLELGFVCPGKIGCGWGVPFHCASVWCSWSGEAVLQGAAGAYAANRAARGLYQGPAASCRGRKDLSYHAAVMCAAREKPTSPALLFRFPPRCI